MTYRRFTPNPRIAAIVEFFLEFAGDARHPGEFSLQLLDALPGLVVMIGQRALEFLGEAPFDSLIRNRT